MLVKDDHPELVRETLLHNSRFVDRIYVLDGSVTYQAKLIEAQIKACSKVVYYTHESEHPIFLGQEEIRPGLRKLLMDHLIGLESPGEWVCLMHGDEIFWDDPNIVAQAADRLFAEIIVWDRVNYFLHVSQRTSLFSTAERLPFTEKISWYCLPPYPVVRQFKLQEGVTYDLNQFTDYPVLGRKSVPTEFRSGAVIKHYPFAGHWKDLKNKAVASMEGLRLKSLTFSWLCAATSGFDLYFDKLPRQPGVMAKITKCFNEKEISIPKVYGE